MRRRDFLAAGTAAFAALAGCAGGDGGSETTTRTTTKTPTTTSTTGPGGLPADGNHDDGIPPEFEDVPEERTVDTSGYETVGVDVDGETIQVPLAPIEDAYYWYRRREARFADARGGEQYMESRIYAAVHSPAPDGLSPGPTENWPKGDRVVCYCGCPHHLSSIRAAHMLASGFEEVYVIDEGFYEWASREYPMAGTRLESRPPIHVVTGRDERGAGGTAWIRDPEGDQVEAGPIAADGTYELELRFTDLSADTVLSVETPSYEVRAPLSTLTDGVVTAELGDR